MGMADSKSGLFNYHGRWEATSQGMLPQWIRPYVEFLTDADFKLDIEAEDNSFHVSVNGEKAEPVDKVYAVNGEALVRITADETAKPMYFKGVETKGQIKKALSRDKHLLFIGDSLTHSPFSHSVVLPRELNCDYTCIAQGGMSLCIGRGYLNRPDRAGLEGMSKAFFKLQSPVTQQEMTDYDFSSGETPDGIFVNLGTNDCLINEEKTVEFKEVYVDFIGKVRAIYPKAKMYLLLPIADSEGGFRRDTIEWSAKKCEQLYDGVTYVSSRGWDVEISEDKIHPTPEGYAAYANELMKFLKK